MKIFIPLLCLAILLPFFAGCDQLPVNSATEPSQSAALESESESTPGEPEIPQELSDLCAQRMYEMMLETTLFSNWEGTPVLPVEPPMSQHLIIKEILKSDGAVTVTAELYGNVHIDPVTLAETIGYGYVWIVPEGEPNSPQLAFGKSVVRFEESGETLTPISCDYERYPHPGLDYLKAQTDKLRPVLEKSEKIDISQYDKLLVDYIWRRLFSHRFIEKPEDITLYDLENLRDPIELPFGSIYDSDYQDPYSPDYSMDASLLRLTPNVESVYAPYRLTDYGVFENMRGLKKLTLQYADEMFSTLKVGHTDELMLYDPKGVLDLSNIDTEILRLYSWSTAVQGFKGCDKIEKLYIMSTRTDMRLVNAEAFPNVSYLNLYFYSDTPRVRDLSQFATFGGAKIDLYLDYQACNNQTIRSLQDVKLNDLYLNPENGSYPLQDIDRSFIEGLDAQNITFGMEMYFQERTGLD